jgi:hypothetical protein
MKRISYVIICFLILSITENLQAQDLDALLNAETNPSVEYTTATFKSTRIINGHSVEQ